MLCKSHHPLLVQILQTASGGISTPHVGTGSGGYKRITEEIDSQIGSLKALELWLNNISLGNGDNFGEKIISPFKMIRRLRQPIAHKNDIENFYDIKIYEEQKEILREIYHTLVNLRIVLSTHPNDFAVDPPKEWNDCDEVCDI